MATIRLCAVDGCGKKFHSHGFCAAHYSKFKRHGDPLAGRRGASPGAPMEWVRQHASYQGDDCVKWPFEIGRYGYGTVKHKGKRRPASRVMCIVAHGEPPTPKHEAAHSCGNGHKACMNPAHLRWATKIENVHDAIAHGTNVRGEKVGSAKLTESDVREIRRLAATIQQKSIAEMYGVLPNCISRIVSRTRWGWLDG